MNAPYNRTGARISNDTGDGKGEGRAFLAHIPFYGLAAVDADGMVDGAQASTGEEAEPAVITEFLAQPDYPRNITVTVAASTAGNIAAGNIVVAGTDAAGDAISENFAVTADTAATITGNLAFKTVTSVKIPVQDGEGVTVDVGWGKKIGIPYKLANAALVLVKLFNGSTDSGTVTASASSLAANALALNGTPDGTKDADLYVIV